MIGNNFHPGVQSYSISNTGLKALITMLGGKGQWSVRTLSFLNCVSTCFLVIFESTKHADFATDLAQL